MRQGPAGAKSAGGNHRAQHGQRRWSEARSEALPHRHGGNHKSVKPVLSPVEGFPSDTLYFRFVSYD